MSRGKSADCRTLSSKNSGHHRKSASSFEKYESYRQFWNPYLILTDRDFYTMNRGMKRCAPFLVLLAAMGSAAFPAIHIEAGALFGTRSVRNADIKAVYGDGMVFFPYAAVYLWEGLFVGAGYEGGYSKSGKTGIYEESTTLKVTGMEFFAGYQFSVGMVSLFLRAGYGSYSTKQVIDSPYHTGDGVDKTKGTVVLAGGLKLFLTGNFFLAGEVRSVPLKVMPYEDEIDLGGTRFTAGIGLKF